MQTARDLVGVVVELPPGVEDRHDDFRRGALFLRVQIHRDATSVVEHRDRAIAVDPDGDGVTVTSQGFVDRVVDHLEDHMVQAGAIVGVTDVHAWALADRFEALQDLDLAAVVGIGHGGRSGGGGDRGGRRWRSLLANSAEL